VSFSAYQVLQKHVGPCREWVDATASICGNPAEFVLWGKLIPAEGLGPRCYDCAADRIGHQGLASRSGWALINLRDLAQDLERHA
jgi:hypothetical protein